MTDIIPLLSGRPAGLPPILLVPGAFSGAWLWQGAFVDQLNAEGFDCYAMTFSGHHKPRLKSIGMRLQDYERELGEAIDLLPEKPILVGYSLGGLVTYRYLRQHTLPAAVLLAPVPPDGLSRSLGLLVRDRPLSAAKLLSLALYPPVRYLGKPPQGLFSENVDPDAMKAIRKQLRAEPLAALLEASYQRAPVVTPETPLHLIGFEGDHITPASEVERSAKALQASCRIYPGMSHSPMAEPEADRVAADMATWLLKQCLPVVREQPMNLKAASHARS